METKQILLNENGDQVKTIDELRAENDKMFAQILADLKEINEITEKTCAILKDVTNSITSRL